MPEVRMTLEEYLRLVEKRDDLADLVRLPTKERIKQAASKPKKAGKAAKGMGRAMREANKRLRTKSGKLRKGKTQADVARLAHKIRRQKYA